MPLQATSGAASYDAFGGGVAAVPNYIEDVFSTWLYTGNGSTQTINNGIDLAGKGGLAWIKKRGLSSGWHELYDTSRGATNAVFTNSTSAQATLVNGVTSFGATGFSVGSGDDTNALNQTFASWTFRKQPKFFDVVTYTGNGTNRTIAHNLGSVPGCIIVKRTDTTSNWQVYHRGLSSAANSIQLNLTNAQAAATTVWNSTAPTSTVFSLGTDASVNASGGTYVAYLFAHDAGGFGLTGTDNVISCGSYTGNGAASQSITLGYEPQLVLMKLANTASSWIVWDTMRGMTMGTDARLFPNNTDAENSSNDDIDPTATGFNIKNASFNGSGNTIIYIAIRRGPMRVPTTGTSVFAPLAYTGNGTTNVRTTGFPVDMTIGQNRQGTGANPQLFDRLRGMVANTSSYLAPVLFPNATTEEFSGYSAAGDSNTSWVSYNSNSANASGVTFANWNFRRAPGFFDVVCYTGTGANRTVAHNLGVAPELMIVKRREDITNWVVYTSSGGATKYLHLNTTASEATFSGFWNNTAPTQSVFSLGTDTSVNRNTSVYVAYLFASCPGVSKVGSYTGNGSSQTINCGFTGGARFVLVKRTNAAGDWYVWDTARGIVAANDPRLSLNTTAAEVTTDDSVDPVSSGFAVNQVAATNINVTSATYIFLAIA